MNPYAMNPYAIGGTIVPGLSKLIEEAGEVMQVAGKLIATGGSPFHWDGSMLNTRLENELADVVAAALFVVEMNPSRVSEQAFQLRVQAKLRTYRHWHAGGT